MIIFLRTDKPEAEIYLYNVDSQVDSIIWEAHRQLAETIHAKIKDLLDAHNAGWSDITGAACYKGPGSFTGLRIGLTVANALASSLGVPVVAETGDNWVQVSLERLQNKENDQIAKPDYGSPAPITQQRK